MKNKTQDELLEEISKLKSEITTLKDQVKSIPEITKGLSDLANKEHLFRSLIKRFDCFFFLSIFHLLALYQILSFLFLSMIFYVQNCRIKIKKPL